MTPAKAAEGMAEALRPLAAIKAPAHFGDEYVVGFVNDKKITAGEVRSARAALSAYEQAKGQGTAWRREAVIEEARKLPSWWWRCPDGEWVPVVIGFDADGCPFMAYPGSDCCDVPATGDWCPIAPPVASPIPAAQVVEAPVTGRYRARREDREPQLPTYAAMVVINDFDAAPPFKNGQLVEIRAIAGTPGKEP